MMMMMTMMTVEIYLCGLERKNERDLSSVGVRKKHSESQI